MGRNFVHLASASPRRVELLRQIGVEFDVLPADILEQVLPGELPEAYVCRIAKAKAAAVWDRVVGSAEPRPVLAADTAVIVDDQVLGKPGTRAEALRMLEQLSARGHTVLTAVALHYEDRVDCLVNASKVRFRATTSDEREAYCDSGEPLDKAGGYAIQGLGAVFIQDLSGSYSSVMGLPLFETASLLRRYRIPAWLHAEDAQS